MPDDDDTTNQGAGATPPAGTDTPATETPAERTFTQEELNRYVGAAREEGRQAALRKATESQETKKAGAPQNGSPVPQEPPPAVDVNTVAQQAVAAALQAAGLDPFSQAARTAGYNNAQIQLARAAHDAAKPADTSKWLSEWPTQVGMTIQPRSNGTGGPTPAASSTVPRKVDDLRDDAGLIDVFSLSPEQVMQMGPAKLREEFEKVIARSRELSGAPPLPAALRRK
jgi:hypothetical protein